MDPSTHACCQFLQWASRASWFGGERARGRADARELLATGYNWFTESSEPLHLRVAKRLLDQLEAASSARDASPTLVGTGVLRTMMAAILAASLPVVCPDRAAALEPIGGHCQHLE